MPSVFTSVLLAIFTLGFLGAENVTVTVYNHTVQEGKSTKFECDSAAIPPFYYYKYATKKTNAIINIADTKDELPWPVYAINATGSSAYLQIIPNFLASGRNESLNVSNITREEFNNVLVCCQGYQSGKWLGNDRNVTSLSVMKCYHVNVQFSPQLMQHFVNFGQWITPLLPSYGQEVVISCPLEGNPPASYQWYFKVYDYSDAVVIQPYNNLNITLLNNNQTLYFEEFKEEHNGKYICNAVNLLGNKTYTHFPRIIVGRCSAFDNTKPSVTINASHNLIAYVGDDLSIECIVASLPPYGRKDSIWFKNESHAPTLKYRLGEFDKIHCRQIITLYFKNLTLEDSGYYICRSELSELPPVDDVMLLTVTVPVKQSDYKSLIVKISIPVSVVIILIGITSTLGIFYYLHLRQVKLQKALEQYCKRPLPKKGDYQYEFFFAMTEDDEDKLEVDKLYIELKQSFLIYYQLDQYLPGRTKVEMVTEGIKNSRFIVILLSKAYLQQKDDEIARLELMYTMSRIEKEFTKCAFIIPLEDKMFIPYKLQHITKFPKEGASIKLKELALSSGDNFLFSEDGDSVDAMELDTLNDDNASLI